MIGTEVVMSLLDAARIDEQRKKVVGLLLLVMVWAVALLSVLVVLQNIDLGAVEKGLWFSFAWVVAAALTVRIHQVSNSTGSLKESARQIVASLGGQEYDAIRNDVASGKVADYKTLRTRLEWIGSPIDKAMVADRKRIAELKLTSDELILEFVAGTGCSAERVDELTSKLKSILDARDEVVRLAWRVSEAECEARFNGTL